MEAVESLPANQMLEVSAKIAKAYYERTTEMDEPHSNS